MIVWSDVHELMRCFPRSFINQHGEFIAHNKGNQYFTIKNCTGQLDIKCKVLEWFSRGAFKTEPFRTKRLNDEFHEFMLSGINQYLQTNFTYEDMEKIYTYLGNECNHEKTIRFVESDYNFAILQEDEK